jgi:hypothetical protein
LGEGLLGRKGEGRAGCSWGSGGSWGSDGHGNWCVGNRRVRGKVARALRAARAGGHAIVGSARSAARLVHRGTTGLVGVVEVHLGVEHGMLLHGLLGRDTRATEILGLEGSNKEGLGKAGNGVVGGVGDSLLGSISCLEAHKTESLGNTIGVHSNGGGGDGTELGEMLLENLLGDTFFQVLNVEVGGNRIALNRARESRGTLGTSLGTTNKEGQVAHLVVIQIGDSLDSFVVAGKVDKSEATNGGIRSWSTLGREFVLGKEDRGNGTALGE